MLCDYRFVISPAPMSKIGLREFVADAESRLEPINNCDAEELARALIAEIAAAGGRVVAAMADVAEPP